MYTYIYTYIDRYIDTDTYMSASSGPPPRCQAEKEQLNVKLFLSTT